MQLVIESPTKIETHGFLMAVEVAAGADMNQLMRDLTKALQANQDVLQYDLDHLGEVEVMERDENGNPVEPDPQMDAILDEVDALNTKAKAN
jgi:hypothetical protein